MNGRWIASLPAEPPSVAEWEDLLVRMEVMARALRVTLEERPEGAGSVGVLRDAVRREQEVARWLQEAARLPAAEPLPRPTEAELSSVAWLAARFGSLRARNFAMLQRRGLEVWRWTAPLDADTRPTAYQVVTALVSLDTEALAALRAGARLGTGA